MKDERFCPRFITRPKSIWARRPVIGQPCGDACRMIPRQYSLGLLLALVAGVVVGPGCGRLTLPSST